METNVQPSFIPKKPVNQPGPKPIRTTSFFSIVATVLFITALVLAGAVIGYKFLIGKQIDQKQIDLQTELDKFKKEDVEDLYRLETRMNVATQLVANHFSPLYFLEKLSDATLKSISFAGLNLTTSDNQTALILLQSKAPDFITVAAQADEFKDTTTDNPKFFKDVSILNPSLTDKGMIEFNISATLDLKQLSYTQWLNPDTVNITSSGRLPASTTPTSQ